MTLPEITLIASFIAGMAVLRFGVPMALTWFVGRVADRVEHSPS